MGELKQLLDRGLDGFEPAAYALDRTMRRVHRRQLNRRLGAGVLALAVFGGAVAGIWTTLRSTSEPARPADARPRMKVTATIPLHFTGTDLGVEGGLVSVAVFTDVGGDVVWIDPATNQVSSSSIPFGCDSPFQWLAAEGGADWVVNSVHGESGEQGALWRIDRTRRRVTLPIPLPEDLRPSGGILAGGEAGSTWVGTTAPGPERTQVVLQVDPATGRVVGGIELPLTNVTRLAAGEGALWAVGPAVGRADSLALVRIVHRQAAPQPTTDSSSYTPLPDRTAILVTELPTGGLATSRSPGTRPESLNVVAGLGAVWVSTLATRPDGQPLSSLVYRVDPATGATGAPAAVPGVIQGLAEGEDALWAVTDRGELWRFDPETGVPLGKPFALFGKPVVGGQDRTFRVAAGAGSVWVLVDNLVLRVDATVPA